MGSRLDTTPPEVPVLPPSHTYAHQASQQPDDAKQDDLAQQVDQEHPHLPQAQPSQQDALQHLQSDHQDDQQPSSIKTCKITQSGTITPAVARLVFTPVTNTINTPHLYNQVQVEPSHQDASQQVDQEQTQPVHALPLPIEDDQPAHMEDHHSLLPVPEESSQLAEQEPPTPHPVEGVDAKDASQHDPHAHLEDSPHLQPVLADHTLNLKFIQSGTIKPAVARLVISPIGYTPYYPPFKIQTLGNNAKPTYPTQAREKPPTATNSEPTQARPTNQSPESKPNLHTAPNPPYHTSATSSSPTRPTNHKQETNLNNPPARLANQSPEQNPTPL